MVVMVLVTVGYALMFGAGSKTMQTRNREQCVQQLQQMHTILMLYAAEHNGVFPQATGATSESALSQLVPVYTTDTSVFICPGSGRATLPPAKPFADRRISYAYCSGLTREAAPATPLVADALVNPSTLLKGDALFSVDGSAPGNNHRALGGNVLFVDGHVEAVPPRAPNSLAIPSGATLLNPHP